MRKLCLLMLVLGLSTTAALADPVLCSTVATWGDLKNLGPDGCIDQDKIYTGFSGNIPEDWSALITSLTLGGTDQHKIQLSASPGGTGLTDGTWYLSYSVMVDPNAPDYATRYISQVQISADINPNNLDSTITKSVYDSNNVFLGSASTTTGGSSSLTGINEQFLNIQESLVIGSNDLLNSFTNTFVQSTAVPEPATYALMGLGLAALGLLRRKRSNHQQ